MEYQEDHLESRKTGKARGKVLRYLLALNLTVLGSWGRGITEETVKVMLCG